MPQLVDGIGDRLVDVVFAAFLVWAVTHLDGEHAPRHHQHRGRPFGAGEVQGKSVGVNRGGGDDDFQIWSARQDFAQVAQQEINVQTALMRLVNDQGVIGLEQRVVLRLRQQDTVSHQFDAGRLAQTVLKPHLKTHHLAQRRFEFFGNSLRHRTRRYAPGLGVANHLAVLPAS